MNPTLAKVLGCFALAAILLLTGLLLDVRRITRHR